MNMALSYLESEIKRKEKIAEGWRIKIRNYQTGRVSFINGNGELIDDGFAHNYLGHLEHQIGQMRTWAKHISNAIHRTSHR